MLRTRLLIGLLCTSILHTVSVQLCFPPLAPCSCSEEAAAAAADRPAVQRPDGVPGIQYRELQHSLEHERDKNSTLRQEILRLRDELHVSKAEGQLLLLSEIQKWQVNWYLVNYSRKLPQETEENVFVSETNPTLIKRLNAKSSV